MTLDDLEKGMSKKRNLGIEYFFVHILGCPLEETWDEVDTGALSFIMSRMSIPKGSRQSVKKVLIDITNKRNGIITGNSWGGSTAIIIDLTPEAHIIYEMVEHGIGSPQIAAAISWMTSKKGRRSMTFVRTWIMSFTNER